MAAAGLTRGSCMRAVFAPIELAWLRVSRLEGPITWHSGAMQTRVWYSMTVNTVEKVAKRQSRWVIRLN
jgi:hypothetical protein